jgi:hypothetical protein
VQQRPDLLNTFERTQYRKSLAIYAGVLAGLELAWLLAFARTVDQLLPAGLLFALFAVGAWRASRSGVVIQTGDKLVVRETSWTHGLSGTASSASRQKWVDSAFLQQAAAFW